MLDFPQDNDALPLVNDQAEDFVLPVLHTVRGEILRLVYSNPDNQYAVIRLRTDDLQDVTLVGIMPGVMEGQDIEAQGNWENHKDHGRQFRVATFRAVLPTTEDGIRRYLASGILPGIGEVYADKIVKKFGIDAIRVLDTCSDRLLEIPGIGKKRITEIRKAWQKSHAERETLIFLQGLGLTPGLCSRIIAKYAGGAAEIVRRNPYRLAAEVDGIGFLSADRIAANLGIAADSPLRLCAGMVYALDDFTQQGHTCCPKPTLLEAAEKLLHAPHEALEKGLEIAIAENKIIPEPTLTPEPMVMLYPRRLRQAEIDLAGQINALLWHRSQAWPMSGNRLGNLFFRLNAAQQQAVEWAFAYPLSIVTGGPGVGKTTVVSQMVVAAAALRKKILLAAPTGRAAKRLSEATQLEAATIHRLLKWNVAARAFEHDRDHPLRADLLVIDEVSMLDTQLAASLFQAIEPGTHVVLVGDKDQLPSVGPGAVLHDLIASQRIPVTHLTEIYRQADGSRIITNAHAVNRGRMPDLRPVANTVKTDFYWVELNDPARAADMIGRLIADRIPNVYGFDPFTEVQVLSPMRKGECGTIALNATLQEMLNPDHPAKESFTMGSRRFRTGDKVMQTANNYDKGVFNGELGQILFIDNETRKFTVQFDVGVVSYEQHEADQLLLAYAVTVHKSQGSEFPAVIIPVLTQHYVMLQRNLLYTGMTRAKQLLILVGSRRALGIAIRNNTPMLRQTRLTQRLTVPAQ